MGNQQSQIQDKTNQLLSTWTEKERQYLKQHFEILKQENKTTLPTFFSKDLYKCIITLLQEQDIIHYLEFANRILLSKDTHTMYLVFENAQVSLNTFVSWVVTSSIPLWFESSGYTMSENDAAAETLINHLVFHAHETEQQKNDAMAWLNEKDQEKNEENNWELKTTTTLTQTEFKHWIQNTPIFINLFQLVVEFILLGNDRDKDVHKRRIQHVSSPKLQHGEFSNLLNPFDYFLLTQYLPTDALSWSEYERKTTQELQHQLVFSSKRDGHSWQLFVNNMVSKGALFIIIKTKEEDIFGGYIDETLKYNKTDWYGNSSNFLFKLSSNKYGIWPGASSSNQHYQYLSWGKKSLPNGFGMGGQFDYCGLWLDSDFIHGHSRAGPLNTTFSSPQLSTKSDLFIIDEVEVWLVRPVIKDENQDEGGGVLSHAQDMEFMEMAGKKMYSKDLGPPDHVKDNNNK